MSTYTTTFTTVNNITSYTWSVSSASQYYIDRQLTGPKLSPVDQYTFRPSASGTFIIGVTARDNANITLTQFVQVSSNCYFPTTPPPTTTLPPTTPPPITTRAPITTLPPTTSPPTTSPPTTSPPTTPPPTLPSNPQTFDNNTYINIIFDTTGSMKDIQPSLTRVRNYLLTDYFKDYYSDDINKTSLLAYNWQTDLKFEPVLEWMARNHPSNPSHQSDTNKLINIIVSNEAQGDLTGNISGYYIDRLWKKSGSCVDQMIKKALPLEDALFIYYNNIKEFNYKACNNNVKEGFDPDRTVLLSHMRSLKSFMNKWRDNFTGIFLHPIKFVENDSIYDDIDYQNFISNIIYNKNLNSKTYNKGDNVGEFSLYNYRLRSDGKTQKLLYLQFNRKDGSGGNTKTTFTSNEYEVYKNAYNTNAKVFKGMRRVDDFYFFTILKAINQAGYINVPIRLPPGYASGTTNSINVDQNIRQITTASTSIPTK